MKKILLFILLVLGTMFQPVFAETIHVKAMENFNTENPPKTFSVMVVDSLISNENEVIFKKGEILEGTVEITDPKRLKRNATFLFLPVNSRDLNGTIRKIDIEYPAKYTTKLNKADMAKSAVLAVGNHFIDGLSSGVAAVEGAIKNEEGNRLKSSAKSIYEHSPLSYVEQGKQLCIKKDEIFLLNFKIPKEEDMPNYEYKSLDNVQK